MATEASDLADRVVIRAWARSQAVMDAEASRPPQAVGREGAGGLGDAGIELVPQGQSPLQRVSVGTNLERLHRRRQVFVHLPIVHVFDCHHKGYCGISRPLDSAPDGSRHCRAPSYFEPARCLLPSDTLEVWNVLGVDSLSWCPWLP